MTDRLGSIVTQLTRPKEATLSTKRDKPTKPTESTKATGRPRRSPYVRVHLTLDETVAHQLEEAWRTHRRPDGSLASGPSAFVEDLISAHIAKR